MRARTVHARAAAHARTAVHAASATAAQFNPKVYDLLLNHSLKRNDLVDAFQLYVVMLSREITVVPATRDRFIEAFIQAEAWHFVDEALGLARLAGAPFGFATLQQAKSMRVSGFVPSFSAIDRLLDATIQAHDRELAHRLCEQGKRLRFHLTDHQRRALTQLGVLSGPGSTQPATQPSS